MENLSKHKIIESYICFFGEVFLDLVMKCSLRPKSFSGCGNMQGWFCQTWVRKVTCNSTSRLYPGPSSWGVCAHSKLDFRWVILYEATFLCILVPARTGLVCFAVSRSMLCLGHRGYSIPPLIITGVGRKGIPSGGKGFLLVKKTWWWHSSDVVYYWEFFYMNKFFSYTFCYYYCCCCC